MEETISKKYVLKSFSFLPQMHQNEHKNGERKKTKPSNHVTLVEFIHSRKKIVVYGLEHAGSWAGFGLALRLIGFQC